MKLCILDITKAQMCLALKLVRCQENTFMGEGLSYKKVERKITNWYFIKKIQRLKPCPKLLKIVFFKLSLKQNAQ